MDSSNDSNCKWLRHKRKYYIENKNPKSICKSIDPVHVFETKTIFSMRWRWLIRRKRFNILCKTWVVYHDFIACTSRRPYRILLSIVGSCSLCCCCCCVFHMIQCKPVFKHSTTQTHINEHLRARVCVCECLYKWNVPRSSSDEINQRTKQFRWMWWLKLSVSWMTHPSEASGDYIDVGWIAAVIATNLSHLIDDGSHISFGGDNCDFDKIRTNAQLID